MPSSKSPSPPPEQNPFPDIIPHPWNVSPREAAAIQKKLAGLVVRENRFGRIKRIAGVDAAVKQGLVRAAVAVLDFPELNLIESAVSEQATAFPYIPGLLSFREGPAIISAFYKLESYPDMLIFDGQGIAHPRRLGIASHIGLLLNIPSIGCAKSRLCGRHDEPGMEKGDYSLLEDKGETIGAAVRTRRNVRPVYVSTGHGIDLYAGIKYVLDCTTRFRLPETTRTAHRLAGGK